MDRLKRIDSSEAITGGSEEYRERLIAENERLQSELRERLETLYADRMALDDQASFCHDQFVSSFQRSLAYEKRHAIDSALQRLSRGEYGTCQECGESIANKHLKPIPWALYCLPCQEQATVVHGWQERLAA